ncbi:MAG TPA: tripartite tricarboxylate transporter substrate binding protein [Pseudolabrys sp.]
MIRLARTLAAALLLAAFTHASASAAWPDRPIHLIVPFPAGSGTDVPARIIGQKLGERIGQSVVVDNRTGASGAIGAELIARATPDGYTIGLVTATTQVLVPLLNSKSPYDPIKDFAPVGMIGGTPYVLVAYPKLEATNLKELIALAKAKPGKLTYGSAGVASLAHLAGALFANQAGISLAHIPYKASAQSVTDLMAGRVDMQFATVAPMLPTIRAGQLRALAVTGSERIPTLPDVPTVSEAGVGSYEASLWIAVVAPIGTPPDIIARLNRELNAVLTGDAKDLLIAQGLQLEPGAADAVTARLRTDIDKWQPVVKAAGLDQQ